MHIDSYLIGVFTVLIFLIVELLLKSFSNATAIEKLYLLLRDSKNTKEDKISK